MILGHEKKLDPKSHVFTVLFVCTGNICRSPLGEQILLARLRDEPGWVEVRSAGTMARVGEPMTEQARQLSVLYGGDPSSHAASELTESSLRRSGLILTATRLHRAAVVSMDPRSTRVTFTIREFARLIQTLRELEPERWTRLTEDDSKGLEAFVREVSAMRGLSVRFASPEDDDVLDPYRGSQDVYDAAGELIDSAVEIIASALLEVLRPTSNSKRDVPSLSDIISDGPTLFRSAATGE